MRWVLIVGRHYVYSDIICTTRKPYTENNVLRKVEKKSGEKNVLFSNRMT